MQGSGVKIFQVVTLAGRPGEWTNRETGQRVTHCSCALFPRPMWSGSYCELYSHAVCKWKLWNLPLSWFVYERIQLNLINPTPKVFKKKNAVCPWRCWTLPFLRFDRERMQLVYGVILLSEILRADVSKIYTWGLQSKKTKILQKIHK